MTIFNDDLKDWPRDRITGLKLRDGDIVAEGQIGDKIWDDKAIVNKRPIGIFYIKKTPVHLDEIPDRNNFYDVKEIRKGKITIIDEDLKKSLFNNKTDTTEISLSIWDGRFYEWENLEVIGNIYEDFE